MRFDWYAATVPGVHPMALVTDLCRDLGGQAVEGRRRLGYSQTFRIVSPREDVLAEVLVGAVDGSTREPHAVSTGDTAPDFAQALRERHPAHRVSRLDAAQDFDEPGAFDRLTQAMQVVADDRQLKGQWITPLDPEDGATFYLGATSAAVRVRAYQKGLQLRKEMLPQLRHTVSPDWARLEVQVRPPKSAVKEAAAAVTPDGAWGFSPWSQELARSAMALDVARVEAPTWRERQGDDEKTMDWMLRQYGRHLDRMAGDLGGWDVLGLTMRDRWRTLQALEREQRKG